MKLTTIAISDEMRDKIKALGRKGETYNDILSRLFKELNKEK